VPEVTRSARAWLLCFGYSTLATVCALVQAGAAGDLPLTPKQGCIILAVWAGLGLILRVWCGLLFWWWGRRG
jgi:hypothetical protein